MQPLPIFDASVLLDISQHFVNYRAQRKNIWYGHAADEDGYWGAIPFVDSLFRGQNQRHLPMFPSIVRGLESSTGELWERPAVDQARIVLRLAQSWWFAQELDYHPVTSHAASQHLRLDRIALAQHYGIPTGYLDLTDDFDVAAFFATCRETPEGWIPVEDGIGVIYRIELKDLTNPFGEYKPLGPQPLPRPTEQCAWVAELPITHSFDGWPQVMIMQFQHVRAVGEHFLDKFDHGKALFPRDPLADVASEIINCREIPKALAEKALKSFADDPHGIHSDQVAAVQHELTQLATQIDYRRVLTEAQVSSLLEDFEWRKRMLADIKVRWRMVRSEPAENL